MNASSPTHHVHVLEELKVRKRLWLILLLAAKIEGLAELQRELDQSGLVEQAHARLFQRRAHLGRGWRLHHSGACKPRLVVSRRTVWLCGAPPGRLCRLALGLQNPLLDGLLAPLHKVEDLRVERSHTHTRGVEWDMRADRIQTGRRAPGSIS